MERKQGVYYLDNDVRKKKEVATAASTIAPSPVIDLSDSFPQTNFSNAVPDTLESELRAYYKSLNKCLHCPKKRKQAFLQDTKDGVADFLANHPDGTFADIVDFLGYPHDLAASYMRSLDVSFVNAYQKRQRRLKTVSVSCLFAVILSLGIFNYYIYHLKSNVMITVERTLYIEEGRSQSNEHDYFHQTSLRDRIVHNPDLLSVTSDAGLRS